MSEFVLGVLFLLPTMATVGLLIKRNCPFISVTTLPLLVSYLSLSLLVTHLSSDEPFFKPMLACFFVLLGLLYLYPKLNVKRWYYLKGADFRLNVHAYNAMSANIVEIAKKHGLSPADIVFYPTGWLSVVGEHEPVLADLKQAFQSQEPCVLAQKRFAYLLVVLVLFQALGVFF